MDPDGVAKAFVEHYYRTFDTNRAALAGLYQEGSMLTFEGDKFMGAAAIVGKLTSLPFATCTHRITTVDCQPSGPTGGMLVFVSGSLQPDGGEHHIKFSQITTILKISSTTDLTNSKSKRRMSTTTVRTRTSRTCLAVVCLWGGSWASPVILLISAVISLLFNLPM